MPLQMIVAMTQDRVIGHKGRMPWRLLSDLRRFRKVTNGHPLIMGATTFFGIIEILGGPLDGRPNIVLSRGHTRAVEDNGGIAASSPEAALAVARRYPEEAFVIGGAQVYDRFLPLTRILHVTHVQGDIEGDTWFPEINLHAWGPPTESLGLKVQDPSDSHPTSYAVYRR